MYLIKRLLFGCIVIILCWSCGPQVHNVTVQNPTDKSITFKVGDAEPIIVGPSQIKQVKVNFGKQLMQVEGGDEEEINLKPGKKYLLNPTKSSYIYEEVVFTDSRSAAFARHMGGTRIKMDTISIMGLPIPGHYKQVNDYVIKDFDYGPRDRIPKQIKISSNQAVKIRVRTEEAFVQEIMGILKEMDLKEAVEE